MALGGRKCFQSMLNELTCFVLSIHIGIIKTIKKQPKHFPFYNYFVSLHKHCEAIIWLDIFNEKRVCKWTRFCIKYFVFQLWRKKRYRAEIDSFDITKERYCAHHFHCYQCHLSYMISEHAQDANKTEYG